LVDARVFAFQARNESPFMPFYVVMLGATCEGALMRDNPVSAQNAQRAAVRAALDRHKVFVSTRRFSGGELASARVIVGGEAYEVSARQLLLLEQGKTPADLALEPQPH
jgi:hypothetical protein